MAQYTITIARGYGSGGRTTAQLLSDELNIPFYDRQLLRLASDKSGINEALFGQADESVRGTSFFRAAAKDISSDPLPPGDDDFLSNVNLFNYQARVIKELAQTESCVIVGRCADYVLRDFPNVLRVYIQAPMDYCVERVRTHSVLSEEEITKLIKSIDKSRATYYRYYTGRDWHDASNYDLCINSASLGPAKCVALIKATLQMKYNITL